MPIGSTAAPYNLPQSVFMMSLGSNAMFKQVSIIPYDLEMRLEAFLKGAPGATSQGPFFTALNKPGQPYPCLAIAPDAKQGDWGTVWGPVVYQAPGNPGATNAMFVAHSPSFNIYVVAIAGTNPTGDTALFVQDLDVAPANMVAWPPAVDITAKPPALVFTTTTSPTPAPTQPFIDAGTASGINVLYTRLHPDPLWNPDTKGTTLAQFLNSVDQTDQTLVFTGHSLGGALSPTLAMLLYPQAAASKPAGAALDSNWANVFILATAGPTPGTPGFAKLFCSPTPPAVTGQTLPVTTTNPPPAPPVPPACSGPYAPVATGAPASDAPWQFSYWNVIYANVYDVVPRAWNALANLVLAPTPDSNGNYPSFFAAGTPLQPAGSGFQVIDPAGPDILSAINTEMTKSGYSGNATPYYAPCLYHVQFNGSWGKWTPGATVYPPAWMATPTPNQVNPDGSIPSVSDLVPWILSAHLGQYGYAYLGFPSPSLGDAGSV